ncbi:hypothetical protein Py17XNL_000704132 [Plasmodium yoelii yoelii]|uniref:Uncharacterized protein n=1 Tax=Plasmodium yoelii yoelii TaxID=73239 RepID=A0AAE9WTE5_PLAYO|nr:hypothetical protein Py17XNL_000704132 [Plasmodium yoelii yoelii]
MSALWEEVGVENDVVLIVSFYENLIKEMKEAYNNLYDFVLILKDKIDYTESPIELCLSNKNNMISDFEINYAEKEVNNKNVDDTNCSENEVNNKNVDDTNCSENEVNFYNTDKLNNILCKNNMSCFKDEITNPKKICINSQTEFPFCEKKKNDMLNGLKMEKKKKKKNNNNDEKKKKNNNEDEKNNNNGEDEKNNNNGEDEDESAKRQPIHYADEIKNIIDMNYKNNKIKETIQNVKLLKNNKNDQVSNLINSYNNLYNLEKEVEEKEESNLGNIKTTYKKKQKKNNICPEYFSDLNFSDNSIDSNKIRIINLVNENKILSKMLNKKKKHYENIIFENIKLGNNSEKNNDYQNFYLFFDKKIQKKNKNKMTNIYNEQVRALNLPDQNKSLEQVESSSCPVDEVKEGEEGKEVKEGDANFCGDYFCADHFCADHFCGYYEEGETDMHICNSKKANLGNGCNNNVYKNILRCKLKNKEKCNECYSFFLRILKECEKIKSIKMNKQNANKKEAHLNCIYNNQSNLDNNTISCNECGQIYSSKDLSYINLHNANKTEMQKSVLLLNSDIYLGANESSETIMVENDNISNISDIFKKYKPHNLSNSNIIYIPEYYYSNINNKTVLNKNVIMKKSGYTINDSNLVSCHCPLQKNNSMSQILTNSHERCASAPPEKCGKCEKFGKIGKFGKCGKCSKCSKCGKSKNGVDSQKNLYKIVSYKNVIRNTLPSNYIDVDVNPFQVPYHSMGSFLSYSNYMGKRKRRKIKNKKLRHIGKRLEKRDKEMKCNESEIQTKNKQNENQISENMFNSDSSDVKGSNMSSEKMSKEKTSSEKTSSEKTSSEKTSSEKTSSEKTSFEKMSKENLLEVEDKINDNVSKNLVDNIINNKIYDLGKSEIKENEKNKINKKSKKKYLKKGEKNKIRKKVYNKQKYYEKNKTILYIEDRDKTYLSEYNDENISVKKKNFENEQYTNNLNNNKYELREKRKIKYILPSINKKLRRDSSRQIFDPFLYNNTWAIKKV